MRWINNTASRTHSLKGWMRVRKTFIISVYFRSLMFIVFRTFLFFWLEYFEFLNGNKILKAFFFLILVALWLVLVSDLLSSSETLGKEVFTLVCFSFLACYGIIFTFLGHIINTWYTTKISFNPGNFRRCPFDRWRI